MLHLLLYLSGQLGLLLVLLISAYGFGATIVAMLDLRYADRVEYWLFGQALGLGALSLIVLGLGALELYYSTIAWALIGIGVVLAVARARRLFDFRFAAPHRRVGRDDLVPILLALIVLLTLGYALFANALTPPVSYDAISYHLAIPKTYISAHRIVHMPFIVNANWPLGTEMLFTLSLLIGSESLAQLVTWSFAVLIGVGLVSFGRGRLSPWGGLLAAAIFFSIPMVATLSGTALIEIPLTCYSFLAFYAFWRWRETSARGWLIASALSGGCAAAAKLNAASIPIVIASLALLAECLARRPANAVRVFVAYGLLSFLVAAPWYLKSWILTGNPFWPFFQPLLGGRDWDALGTEYLLGYIQSPNLDPTVLNWLLGLWYLTTNGLKFGSFLIGPYLIVLMPLAILPATFDRRSRPLLGALAFASLGLYSIWFMLTHQTRFLMPATPLMALLASAGVIWLWRARHGTLRWALRLTPIVWLLAGAWVFNPGQRHDWALRWPYLTGQMSRDTYLSEVFADYPVFRYANETLPRDSLLLTAPYDGRGYFLDHQYIWANPVSQRILRMEQYADVAAFSTALRQLGVTHMLLNNRYVLTNIRYWEHDQQLINELAATRGRLMFSSAGSQLYELDLGAGTRR